MVTLPTHLLTHPLGSLDIGFASASGRVRLAYVGLARARVAGLSGSEPRFDHSTNIAITSRKPRPRSRAGMPEMPGLAVLCVCGHVGRHPASATTPGFLSSRGGNPVRGPGSGQRQTGSEPEPPAFPSARHRGGSGALAAQRQRDPPLKGVNARRAAAKPSK
jgi:hypothetical protein